MVMLLCNLVGDPYLEHCDQFQLFCILEGRE